MKTLAAIFAIAWLSVSAFGQTYIGHETDQVIPSSAYWSRVIGNWPDSNSVQTLNPPVFKWIYDETPAKTFDPDIRYFEFQLSTNAAPFSATYWDITCSNNFYNFVPPITNADGSAYTGPCFSRIGYYNSNMVFVAWGPTNIFRLSSDATPWDRSMLGNTNYLLSIATNHPHMYWTTTNIAALGAWFRTPGNMDFHSQSYSSITNQIVTFYQKQGWWTNAASLLTTNQTTILSVIGGATECAWGYYASGSNAMFDLPSACSNLSAAATTFHNNGWDRVDPYTVDPGAEQTLALGYDWLYPFMSNTQRTNVEYVLRSLVLYGVWGGACFYGDQNFTATNTDYPVHITAAPFYSIFKLGTSHARHDVPVGTMACIATMGEDPITLGYFPMFANYSIFQLDPDQGDEGRGYAEQDNFKYDREWSAAAACIVQFPEAQLWRNPLLSNLSQFFAHWQPAGYRGVFENWGDLSFGFQSQMYHYRYHDLADFLNDGALLRQYNRQYNTFRLNGADEFPILGEAFYNYYFPKPTETDAASTTYFDANRGWAMSSSLPPTDYGAYTNAVQMVFQARPAGRSIDHGSFTDGQVELFAYGAAVTAAGAANGYAKHPMFYNVPLVNGIGTRTQVSPPSDAIYSFFTHWTNNPQITYAAANITKAYNRTNFVQGGLGNMTQLFYQQASNTVPQVSDIEEHVLFPYKRFLVQYYRMITTTNSYFQFPYHVAETNCTVDAPDCSFVYTCTNAYNTNASVNVTVYVWTFASTNSIGLLNESGIDKAKLNPFTGENYLGKDNDTGPFVSSVIWITNTVPTTNCVFSRVTYPAAPGEAAPTFTRRSDNSFDLQTATLHVGVSFGETNAALQALNLGTNYFIITSLDASTNLLGGGGNNPAPGPVLYAPFWNR